MTAHADRREGYTRLGPRAPNSPVNSPAILLHDPLYVNGLISISICLPPWMTLLNICWMKEGIPLQSYNCRETEDDASSLLFKQPRWGVAMATWDHIAGCFWDDQSILQETAGLPPPPAPR